MAHLLEVNNLQTHFPTRSGLVRAVDGVSFHLDRGELLGLVGELRCGKSITALSVLFEGRCLAFTLLDKKRARV